MYCDNEHRQPNGSKAHDYNTIVSDTVLCPRPFYGAPGEEASQWLNYFEKYAAYSNLQEQDKTKLFGVLMGNSALDWITTLAPGDQYSYAALKRAFTENYLPSPALRWIEASAMWRHPQGPSERTDDFLTRIKEGVQRLQISHETLHHCFIQGLRKELCSAVLVRKISDLQNFVKRAKNAEANFTNADPLTTLLMENMKSNTELAQKQAADIKELTEKVKALSTISTNQNDNAMAVAAVTRSSKSEQDYRPQSDYARQRYGADQTAPGWEHTRRTHERSRQTGGGWRGMGNERRTRTFDLQTQGSECSRCGLEHRQAPCPTATATCGLCLKQDHYKRCCKSARVQNE
jgi:hypothetical protein